MSESPQASILIIDDEPIIRESIAVYLEDSGFRVTEAGDGREGLEKYRAASPDVVLVDLRMPEVDGLDVLSTVSRETPETPVIVVSGTGVIHDAIEALRRGAWDFLTKPIPDLAVLEHTVRKAIERRRLLVENRRYREHLEVEVDARTADLHERTQMLEQANQELETAMQERLVAEETLRQKVDEQTLLLDNIHTQIWYLSDEKTYGAVNKARAEFLGLSKDAMERKPLPELLSAQEVDVCVEGNREVFERRCQIHKEEWALNGRGEKRLLSITKTPKLDADGGVEYVVCSAEDITDMKNAEDALRRAKERLSLALEVTQHAIWDWNLQTNAAYFSPRYYTMLGYAPHEKIESLHKWKDLLHAEDRQVTLKRIDDYLAGRISAYQTEFRMKSKQGRYRWILGRGKIVEWDASGKPLRMIGTHADITDQKLSEEALRMSEAHLRVENTRLKSTLKGANQFGRIIGRSPVMQDVYETILKAATSNANIIIYGESGTGKELAAQTIHDLSERSRGAFVAVNCGAIPDNLMESEFFGYKKGAFTGADHDRPGYLESAHGGTLFLDEVGELDLNMQVKLLRVIDGAGYMPIGGRQVVRPDVRFIAATHRDLQDMIRAGKFREDFFYRIHIVPIHMPPLRARMDDLTLLERHFLDIFCEDGQIVSIPEHVQSAMKAYDWPGNVRELQNAIHRFVTLKEVQFSVNGRPAALPPAPASPAAADPDGDALMPLKDVAATAERRHIRTVLEKHQWQRGKVADLLGVNRRTLFRKMKELKIG
ncbi:MAG: sigma 54-interacting transcriptional regulator [Pseudomonadota bacterium]